MSFITINQDNIITEVYSDEIEGGIELTDIQLNRIMKSRYGHSQFLYINNDLVINTEFVRALRLAEKKEMKKEAVISRELRRIAEQSAVNELIAIDNAATEEEIDLI